MKFSRLPKLTPGDKVAILSPSFAAPAVWPHVYELGLSRIREEFGLVPVEFPTTKLLGASKEARSQDLIDAFENPEIKGIITTLGGDDQVTYIKNLPVEPFMHNPKPFFGFSDSTHFANHLWLCGVPSYYGGTVLIQFGMQVQMNPFTTRYLKRTMFEGGTVELERSEDYTDIDLDWNDPTTLTQPRTYEKNGPWVWDLPDSAENVSGIVWGGCLESIDEMLRHGVPVPTLEQFEEVILLVETAEEIPKTEYVMRVMRALGERGILAAVKGLLVGRPPAWSFTKQWDVERKALFRKRQQEIIVETVRKYNLSVPIVQNLDVGHTNPQICLPLGMEARIDVEAKSISADF